MNNKQSFQPPDTGKLTNPHFASEKDDRTPALEQKAKKRQQSK